MLEDALAAFARRRDDPGALERLAGAAEVDARASVLT